MMRGWRTRWQHPPQLPQRRERERARVRVRAQQQRERKAQWTQTLCKRERGNKNRCLGIFYVPEKACSRWVCSPSWSSALPSNKQWRAWIETDRDGLFCRCRARETAAVGRPRSGCDGALVKLGAEG